MISQAQKDRLKELGFNVDELITAITSENETDIAIPNGTLFTDELLTSRDTNNFTEGKKLGVTEGKKAGFEIANKTIIEKFGLKDVTKNDEPNKILDILNSQFSKGDEGLQGQIKALQADKTELENKVLSIESEKKAFERNTSILSMLPKNRASILSDTEYLDIVNKHITDVDGVSAITINGEVLRDKQSRNIVPLNDGITKLFTERKWIVEEQPTGGRGQGDTHRSVGGIKTLSQARETFLKDNPDKNEASPEFISYVKDIAQKTSDFDVNA